MPIRDQVSSTKSIDFPNWKQPFSLFPINWKLNISPSEFRMKSCSTFSLNLPDFFKCVLKCPNESASKRHAQYIPNGQKDILEVQQKISHQNDYPLEPYIQPLTLIRICFKL